MLKAKFTLLTTIMLSFMCAGLNAQDNPFMPMAGKKYADYSRQLYDEYRKFIRLDTFDARNMIRQIEYTAEITGDMAWHLQTEYFKTILFDMKRSLEGDGKYPAEQLLNDVFVLLEKAKKERLPHLELRCRYNIIDYYWNYVKNYELAFEQCLIQEKQLQNFSYDVIPEKALYYVQIANGYYFFKDYKKAISYFEELLQVEENIHNQQLINVTNNMLGLIYRYGYHDLDRSDSCFNNIIRRSPYLFTDEYVGDKWITLEENENNRDNWNGIAEGNLGYNLFLRERYNEAIPLLKSSIEKMLRYNDYGYASGPAINLADIYLKKDDAAEAKRYIDYAVEYYTKSPRNGRLARIYESLSKYYVITGNTMLSIYYFDLMLEENKQTEEQFNAALLLRIEQKESAARKRELEQETAKWRHTQTLLMILSFGLVIIFGLLGWMIMLYRKRSAAYRELVRKSQEWAYAHVESGESKNTDKNNKIYEIYRMLFNQFQQTLQTKCLYREPALSIEDVARILKVNRNHLSRAINRCSGKNFSACINEYRIKEAVRIMSDTDPKKYSIEEIAYKVGYDERKTFYNAFKKMTGLSPSHFKERLSKGDSVNEVIA